MNRESIEVLDTSCNAWIVRTPGREYPGMVIQGDSLKSVYDLAWSICRLLKQSKEEEAYDLALQIEDDLGNRLVAYEGTLKENGFRLPYPGSVSQARRSTDGPQS